MERISVAPIIRFGKSCVAGTRIAVQDVLELIDAGLSISAIIADYYPELTPADIYACMDYSAAV